MTYDSRKIVNFILDKCNEINYPITNLALQKIIYFCHVYSLIGRKMPLIKHKFEAWECGPVLSYLYNKFKTYNDKPINGRLTKLDMTTGNQCIVNYNFDEETTTFLTEIINMYCSISATQLIELSHISGGPWDTVYNSTEINPGMKIEDIDIISFYSQARI